MRSFRRLEPVSKTLVAATANPEGRAGERRIAASLIVDSLPRLTSSSLLALLAPRPGAAHEGL